MMQVTEEVFLSEIHSKLNELNDLTQLAVTVAAACDQQER